MNRIMLNALLLLTLLSSGCRFGLASFEGSFGEEPFDPVGTVFAFEDATDDAGFEILDQALIETGVAIEQEKRAGVLTGEPNLRAGVQLRPEVLDNSSTYADFIRLGSLERTQVAITALDESLVSGEMSHAFVRDEDDAADLREASVSGEFEAPLISEAIAEHNLRVLGFNLLRTAGLGGLGPSQ